MNDLISRQAAIDALWKLRRGQQMLDDTQTADKVMKGIFLAEQMIKELPTVDIDLSDYSDRLWRKAYEQGKADAEPRWIPVTERLPEDIRPVIVTWKNTDPKSYYQYIVGKHFTGTACYKNGKWYWYSSTTEDMLAEYGRYDSEEFDEAIECIAWMPLPEPYEGESDE